MVSHSLPRDEYMPESRGLFEVAREKIRTRHLAFRTEQAYLHWMRRYVKFHNRRHPRDMGAPEVESFLTHLAVEAKVGASTQNQALQALLFLYRHVLGIELPWLENVTRAVRPKKLPVVLTVAEVRALLAQLDGSAWLIANILYGSGLRIAGGGPAAGQGYCRRAGRNHRTRREGGEGSGDGSAAGGRSAASGASGEAASTVPAAAQAERAGGIAAGGVGAQVSERVDSVGLAVRVSGE